MGACIFYFLLSVQKPPFPPFVSELWSVVDVAVMLLLSVLELTELCVELWSAVLWSVFSEESAVGVEGTVLWSGTELPSPSGVELSVLGTVTSEDWELCAP